MQQHWKVERQRNNSESLLWVVVEELLKEKDSILLYLNLTI